MSDAGEHQEPLSKEDAIQMEMAHIEDMREEMASMLHRLSEGEVPEQPDDLIEDMGVLEGESITIEIDRGFFSLITQSIEEEFMGTLTSPVPAILYSTLFLELVGQHQDAWMDSVELKDGCDCPNCSGEGTPQGLVEMLEQAASIEEVALDDSDADIRGFQ